MGQKINPIAYRIAADPRHGWKSRWFALQPKRYADYLMEDYKLRQAIGKKLETAGVMKVEIERSLRSIRIIIYVTRPGMVIGRGGTGLEELKRFVYSVLGHPLSEKKGPKIDLQVEEVKEPDLSARLVATRIAEQLAKRMSARRVVNKAIERTMGAGAKGVKIVLSGRIGGAEIARRELYQKGAIPLQTLRADIDYVHAPALTRSGYVGVKVWICRGEKS